MHFLLFILHSVSFMCISFMCVFLCFCVLFAVCVNGPLWTDFQINGMEWNDLVRTGGRECKRRGQGRRAGP